MKTPPNSIVPRLFLGVAALFLGAACSCSGGSEHPNVILIVVDTLRADRVGCYGYSRPTTPEIDDLAKDGMRFENCVAQAPWTLPSMSSMLTSRYLTQHREWPEPEVVPLAECFQQAGYATVGVSANVLLAKDHHFDRGYDDYDASFGPADNDGKPFDMLYDAIWAPVEKALATKKPLFLSVQPFDPHFTYKPHPEFDAQLPCDGAMPAQPSGWWQKTLAESGVPAPADDPDWGDHARALQHLRGQYEQEVRFTDEWLGKTLARLKELGVLENAVVAIVSDHGEGLWEHVNKAGAEKLATLGPNGFFFAGHAYHVYEEAVRTPFVLWGRGVPKGERFTAPVENVDLFPTLCALAGVAPPVDAQGKVTLDGRDLTRLFGGPKEGPRDWREHVFAFMPHVAMVRERSTGLKLIAPTCSYRAPEEGVPTELFDVPRDPDERMNLLPSRANDATRLLDVLQRTIDAHPTRTTWNQPKPPKLQRKISGHGYDGVGDNPDEPKEHGYESLEKKPPPDPRVKCD